ncbi:MAG: hypothetical protein JSU95_03580 [Betaproteobacteria bacterium]|nr:MAG: hypothetical protein JSU95_03580 [Betaproteobacteria bacterium]
MSNLRFPAFLPIACIALAAILAVTGDLRAREIEYEVKGGKLVVFGHVLEPVYSAPEAQAEGRVVFFHRSPDKKWIVIQSGYRIEVDLWLYNTRTNGKPVRIECEPGNHTTAKWYGSKVFEISWGGMGYEMSQLFRVDDTRTGKRVDGMLLYEPHRDVYVSLVIDDSLSSVIEVGRAFNEQQLERFKLDLEYEYVSEARFAINDTRIVGNKLVVTHTRLNGDKVESVFSPQLLQQ